jgi:hypothetical protein
MELLTGGRKRRRPRGLAQRLWLAAAGIAGVVAAAALLVRL